MWISNNRSREPCDLIYGMTPFPGCTPSLVFGFSSKRIMQSLFVNGLARTHVWVGDGQFTYSNMSIEHTWPAIFNFFFLTYTSAKNLKKKSYGF